VFHGSVVVFEFSPDFPRQGTIIKNGCVSAKNVRNARAQFWFNPQINADKVVPNDLLSPLKTRKLAFNLSVLSRTGEGSVLRCLAPQIGYSNGKPWRDERREAVDSGSCRS
jgi:hypothetical protein